MGTMIIRPLDSDVLGAAELNVIEPLFIKGWWSDEKKQKIKQALLSDIVRFHISTKGIPDGTRIKITFMDDDGFMNPDDIIYHSEITINSNYGYIELELPRRWITHIDEDTGDAIELYAKCEYKNIKVQLPYSSDDCINIYNIGYISHNDCRIRVTSDGVINLCPENMNSISYNAWQRAKEDLRNWEGEIGINKGLGYLSFKTPSQDIVSANNNDSDPNANDGIIKTQRGTTKTGQEDRRQKQRTIVTASPSARVNGAIFIAIVDIIISVMEYGLVYLQVYENEKIKKHIEMLNKVVCQVANWLMKNQIPNQYSTFSSFYQLVNIVLFGDLQNSDPELTKIAKKIYKSNTSKYEKQ